MTLRRTVSVIAVAVGLAVRIVVALTRDANAIVAAAVTGREGNFHTSRVLPYELASYAASSFALSHISGMGLIFIRGREFPIAFRAIAGIVVANGGGEVVATSSAGRQGTMERGDIGVD